MERNLWAPWRMAYIRDLDRRGEDAGTPGGDDRSNFLLAAWSRPADDLANHVVHRDAHGLVMLNRYPYTNGHLLVAPLEHRATLGALADAQLLDLQQALARWCGIIEREMQAEGFNVGLNLGAVAGAGLPGHLHWHIVPRWRGDVNFMPTIAGVRVMPQALDALWDQLRGASRSQETQAAGGAT